MRIVYPWKKIIAFVILSVCIVSLAFCYYDDIDSNNKSDVSFGVNALIGGGSFRQSGEKKELMAADFSLGIATRFDNIDIGISPSYSVSAHDSANELNTFHLTADLGFRNFDGSASFVVSGGYDFGMKGIELGASVRFFVDSFYIDLLKLSVVYSPVYDVTTIRAYLNCIVLFVMV